MPPRTTALGRRVAASALRAAGLDVRRIPRPVRARTGGSQPAHVLVACFPKSGSTYLSTMIELLPGMSRVSLVPEFGRREQELDRGMLAAVDHVSYVAQHHVRLSEATRRCIDDHALRPVVLVRDLADACVSFADHLRRESVVGPVVYAEPAMQAWDDERLLDFVVDMAAPWYLGFYVSWHHHADKLLVRFDDLVTHPASVLAEVADHARLGVTTADIDGAIERAAARETRLNVGRAGRGDERLTAAMKDRLRKVAAYYPEVDLGPIGL